jgi:Domain of unknown function (DUF4265)
MNLEREGLTQVTFEIDAEEAEATGVSVEHVWAQRVGQNEYKLRNTPMFAFGFSLGDVVRGERSIDEDVIVKDALSRSGRTTLRVYLDDEASGPEVKAGVQKLGGFTHGSDVPELFAIDVGPDVHLNPVLEWLEERGAEGVLEFEPGFIASEHAEEVTAARGDRTPDWVRRYL